MVTKQYCDVCGVQIPNSTGVEHNKAAKMFEGRFVYGAIVCDEMDDLCASCGKEVRDFIRVLKRKLPGQELVITIYPPKKKERGS